MTPVLVTTWIVGGALLGWTSRPVSDRRAATTTSGHDAPIGYGAVLDRLGAGVLRRVPLLQPSSPRTVAVILLGSMALLPTIGLPMPVLTTTLLLAARSVGRRAATLGAERDLREVAVIADLVGIAVSSGLGPTAALVAVAARLRPDTDAGLVVALATVERGGSIGTALDRWAATGATAELVALLRSSDSSGVAVVDALDHLARDLRRRRRRSVEQRARRLPVTILLPLVSCILPAFGLLTIVPMVAVGLGRLTPMT